jgi:hypothetical protein
MKPKKIEERLIGLRSESRFHHSVLTSRAAQGAIRRLMPLCGRWRRMAPRGLTFDQLSGKS